MSKDATGYFLAPTTNKEVNAIEDVYTTEDGKVAGNYSKIWAISPWTRVHIQFNIANHVAQCKGDCKARSDSQFSPWNCIVKCRYSQDHWMLSCHKELHENVCHLNYNLELPERPKNDGGLMVIKEESLKVKQKYYEMTDPDNCGDISDKLNPIIVYCRHCRHLVTISDYICPGCYMLNPQQLFQFFSKLPNLLVNTIRGPADQQYADYLNNIIKERSPELFKPPALPVTKMNQPVKIKPEFAPEIKPPLTATNNNNNNSLPNNNILVDDDCKIVDAPTSKRKIEDDNRSSERYFVIPDDEDNKTSTDNKTEDDSFYFQKRKKQKTTQ